MWIFLNLILITIGIAVILKPLLRMGYAHGSSLINRGERGNIEAFLFTSRSQETYNLLYFKDSSLTIFCQLRNRVNDTKDVRNALVRKYSSQGMSPTVTFTTLAWSKSYEFENLVEDENIYWTLNISKSELFQQVNSTSYGKTYWKYKVELGNGIDLFESWGTVVFPETETLLSVTLGDEMEEVNENMAVEDVIFWQHPCSLTVALFALVRKEVERSFTGCYVAVTHGGFTANTTRWFNLLHLSSGTPNNYSICKESSFSLCEKLSILDMTVVGQYILIVTSKGLVKSQLMENSASSTNKTKLRFDKVNSIHRVIDAAFNNESLKRGEIKLQDSAQCCGQDLLVKDAHVTYLVYTAANRNASLLFYSEPPFDVWSLVQLPHSLSGLLVLGATWDFQRRTAVLLLEDRANAQYEVAVFDRESSQLLQPVFQFPPNATLTSMTFHAYVHGIFVYGPTQVWQSIDGGNSFYEVHGGDLTSDQITSLFINSLGDAFVLVTKFGAVYSGLSGIPRFVLIEPAHTTPNCTAKLVTFHWQKSIGITCLQKNSHAFSFQSYTIDLNSRIKVDVKLLFRPLLVRFTTEREVEVWAFCDDAFFTDGVSCSETFRPSDVGRVLNAANGGSAIITRVDTNDDERDFSARVTCFLLTPFTQLNSSAAPALQYPLHVNLTDSTAQLRLGNSLNNTGWQGEDVGRTIQLSNGASLIITACISKSDATGKSLSDTKPYVSAFEEGAWALYDFRPFQASRPLGSLVLHVNHTSNDSAELNVLNQELFVFKSEHIGKVLKCGHGWGRIISVVNNLTSVIELNNVAPGNHTNNWGVYNSHPNPNNNSHLLYLPDPHLKVWWLAEDECRHFLIETPRGELEIFHLDSNEELSFTLRAISKGSVGQDPTMPLLRLHIGNAVLFHVDSVYQISTMNHTLRVYLKKRPFIPGISSIIVRLRTTASLLCQGASYIIHGGCPPTKKLRFLYPLLLSSAEFLNSEVTDGKGIVRNFKLPSNYRAPSSRGKAIPTSENIYNVDPQKPLYKTSYDVTRKTLRYKQCHGKTYRADCGCTDEQRASSLVKFSDCIDTVYRVLFSETLTPRFVVLQDAKAEQPLSFPYYLEEVNKRRDFAIVSPSDLVFASVDATVLEQEMNSSIQFEGSGMYHFRARVVQENYTFCPLEDEFIVFVVDTPLPFPVNDVVRACTGMGFVSLLFIVYIRYFHGKKKMKND